MSQIMTVALVAAVVLAVSFLTFGLFRAAKWLVKVAMFLAVLAAMVFLLLHLRS